MGSGEGDAPRAVRSLDGWPYCAVSGCYWRVSYPRVSYPAGNTECRCREHGGHPVAEVRTDEWGNTETHVDRPAMTWEPWD
jgi:hypothetical protein